MRKRSHDLLLAGLRGRMSHAFVSLTLRFLPFLLRGELYLTRGAAIKSIYSIYIFTYRTIIFPFPLSLSLSLTHTHIHTHTHTHTRARARARVLTHTLTHVFSLLFFLSCEHIKLQKIIYLVESFKVKASIMILLRGEDVECDMC